MARELTFKLKKKEFTAIPKKVERKKLYGWTEIVATDENGNPCNLVNTDDTGTIIIPKGGTSLGILSSEGEWVDRSTLKTVKTDGTPAEIIPSSYSITISLSKKVSEEEYLDHSITDFYQLTTDPSFVKAIGDDIYIFDYIYLDGYETTPAFLMGSEGNLFMLLGYKNKFEMLCLTDCKIADEDDDDYIEVTEDDIDFTMF